MGSLRLPNGIPNAVGDNSQAGAPKRKLSESPAGPPTKVTKRSKPTAVKVTKLRFFDTRSPQLKEQTNPHHLRQMIKYDLIYKYSAIKDTEIRLLYIEPALRLEDDIFVSIKTIADDDVGSHPLQEYEALSYHWGPGPADKPVFISNWKLLGRIDIDDIYELNKRVPDYAKGQRLYVRPNLDKALRHLRHETEVAILWVDAICINQADEKVEKPGQIAKMKQIYNRAVNVCIWLGDGTEDGQDHSNDFQDAMEFSKTILDLKMLEKLCQDKLAAKRWSDLLDLMRCSWFSRRWVIQELALAREATVHCGNKCVHWQDFADAIGLFVVNFDNIRALFRQSHDNKISQNYRSFNELAPLGAKVLVDAITNTFRKSADGKLFEPVSDLETLVSSLSTFESSDPRDTIFALLNIARESLLPAHQGGDAIGPPKPNYEKNLLEVYADFLEWVVYSTNSMDIICRHWAMPERTTREGRKDSPQLVTLPSWIQMVSGSAWGTQEQGFNGRMNGDSLVGRAGRRRYNASHGKTPEVQFGVRWTPDIQQTDKGVNPLQSPRPTSHILRVEGVVIDEISWTSGAISRGVIPKDCLERGGWQSGREIVESVPDKLWRTLVADRTAEGENPPPWYHRAVLNCMALADNNGNIGTREILDREGSTDDKLPRIVIEYLKRVQSVIWNRKFLEGAPKEDDSKKLFGIGPPKTQNGDLICILFGCSVPCILRPCDDVNYWKFVGEAFICGIMDGEAITSLSARELSDRTTQFSII